MIANQSARDQIGMMRAIRLEYVRAIVGIRTRSQNLSLPPAQAGGYPAQSGMGDGPDLYSHGAWFCLPLRRRGLVQPSSSVVAIIDHDGGGLLYRSGRGSAGSLWKAGHIQHRPGIAVHIHRLHGGAEES